MSEYIITTEQLWWLRKQDIGRKDEHGVPEMRMHFFTQAIENGDEIVRCNDCRHFKKGEEKPPIDWCDYFHDEVTPLGFCAWGERREP